MNTLADNKIVGPIIEILHFDITAAPTSALDAIVPQ